jgi:dihydrolipoamide dehydrogenase
MYKDYIIDTANSGSVEIDKCNRINLIGFANKQTGQILGAQVIGHDAASLIAEIALAIANELTVDCIADTIHAHPTLPEAWLEAALLANDTPIHLPPKVKKV